MKLHGHPYEVNILGQDNQPIALTSEGYVPLAHRENYKISLKGSPRSSAKVCIDGVVVGDFLVPDDRAVVIERPADVQKLFTFLKDGSKDAKQALLDTVSDKNLGLISVTFVPERRTYLSSSLTRGGFGAKGLGLGAGGTGLSGVSNQRFTEVYFEGDEERKVTLNLRLAHDPSRTIPSDITPLSGRYPASNEAPAPLGRG